PVPGALVQLYSDNNQVMDKQTTDESGRVTFVNWRKNEFHFNPHFLVVQKDDDFSFLYFDRTELNQQQFAVGGDPYATTAWQAFLTPERGVYRPGEKAYITAMVRKGDGSLPEILPLRLTVRDPRGADVQRLEQSPDANGLMTFTIPFAGDALTGRYDIQLTRLDRADALGSTSLKVEEFIPDKLKVDVVVPPAVVAPGQALTFQVKSRQLFGPPASGSKVVTTVRFLPRDFSSPAYKNYTFSDPTRSFDEDVTELGEDTLDKGGSKEYSVETPRGAPPSALKAYIYTEVFDSGGRPVSAAGFADINPYPNYVGLRLDNTQAIHARDTVTLHFVDITPAGRLKTEDNVQVVIKRKAWYSIFRRSSWGRSGYQSSSYEELITHQPMRLKGQAIYQFSPQQAGEYTVFIVSPNGMRSGLSFDVLGAGYEATSLESPEKLTIVPDKDAYEIGDQARFLIQTPFTGKLIVTLEREKVYETRVLQATGHETSVSFPVEARDLPNMYVVGMLLRTPDEDRQTLPMASFGIAALNVKTTSKRIPLTWDVAKAAQSSNGIDVGLQIPDSHSEVVLAAVDQGILQITNFTTPNPLEYFYRKRGLTTQSYSIFDLILPDLKDKTFALGGDEGGRFSRRHLNPIAAKKKKSMAVYSGILHPDESGHVRYHFDTKDFNGDVRIMALVVRGDHFGSGEKPVEVADPIVLIPNYPRFVAPGDQFQIPIELYNKTGKAGAFTTRLRATGPVKIVGQALRKIELAAGDQKRLVFLAEADANAGVAGFHVESESPGYRSVNDEELSVRPANALVTRVVQGELAPGRETSFRVPGGFIPYGQRIRLTVSNNPIVRYLRALDYLITYPYGCAEQITSQLFPLIYFKTLGFATGRFADQGNAVDLFVADGIHQLEKQQLEDGRFTLWPGGEVASPWVCHYVAHFLVEAKGMGFDVQPITLERIQRMIGEANVAPRNEGRLDRRTFNVNHALDTYLLYIKTLVGQPDMESMAQLKSPASLPGLQETDRDLLSLAYSRLGDRASGAQVLAPDFKSRFLYREQYGDFNSPVRNTAMYLMAVTESDPASSKIPQIIDYLGQQIGDAGFGNTQENSWGFMALAHVFKDLEQPIRVRVSLESQPYKVIADREAVIADIALSGRNVSLKNEGTERAYYYLLAEGTPLDKSTQAASNGLQIERSFVDHAGKPANLTNVVQGDLMVVTLTIRPQKGGVHNVVIVDLLPAGLEIENPRLRSRGQLEFEPPAGFDPAYQDIRDDRILLFVNELDGELHFSYTVRAVTPGRFTVPNAYAEAMYDPSINGQSYEPRPMVIVDDNAP
ncbi:MAG TPA: MG2 domain-containing protein, partial [Elusimicrobiota bacterium]|nr:MG2 domain-containing protein [Elusimicrobiota bacterium]